MISSSVISFIGPSSPQRRYGQGTDYKKECLYIYLYHAQVGIQSLGSRRHCTKSNHVDGEAYRFPLCVHSFRRALPASLPHVPRTRRRRGSLAGSPSPNHEWGIQLSGKSHESQGYMSACASCTGSTRSSETPATSFPYPSAYFTPRVVHAAAPLHTIHNTQRKKATHISVSRLSFGVIRRLRMVLHPARCRRTCAVGMVCPLP